MSGECPPPQNVFCVLPRIGQLGNADENSSGLPPGNFLSPIGDHLAKIKLACKAVQRLACMGPGTAVQTPPRLPRAPTPPPRASVKDMRGAKHLRTFISEAGCVAVWLCSYQAPQKQGHWCVLVPIFRHHRVHAWQPAFSACNLMPSASQLGTHRQNSQMQALEIMSDSKFSRK